MLDFAPLADLHLRAFEGALLLPPPVLASCPAPPELEEPPELLLLAVDPATRKLS
jgi:hypothetical protein